MKRLLVSAAVLGLFSSTVAFAQSGPVSAPATTPADATIVSRITVTSDGTHLNFGSIAAPVANAGTVTVSAAGALSSSPTNLLIAGTSGSAAHFLVAGDANLAYTPTVSTPITLTSGANSMSAALSVDKPGPTGGTLDGTGADSFNVYGTLSVGQGQAAGVYHGTVSVTVQYN